jgi:hypothetical protein
MVCLTQLLGVLTVLNLASEGSRTSYLLYLLLIQFLGPIGGWVESIRYGFDIAALPLLLFTTVVALAPIFYFIWKKTLGWLLLSCILWWFFGYLFAFGIWI